MSGNDLTDDQRKLVWRCPGLAVGVSAPIVF